MGTDGHGWKDKNSVSRVLQESGRVHSHRYETQLIRAHQCPSVVNLLFSCGSAALGPSVVSILSLPMEDEHTDGVMYPQLLTRLLIDCARLRWPNESTHRHGAKGLQNEDATLAPGSCGAAG